MFNKNLMILLPVLIFGLFLRLFLLDRFPVGASGDEIQQGYSAYSILKTGKDEWGESLPLFPRGFGDYKPPLLTYLMIPSVAIFDLNIFAIRLPTALLGSFTILVVYFLAKKWFVNAQTAFWSAFLLAVSPWHIQLSRIAFEGNIGIFFFTLGFWMYLKGKERTLFYFLSAFFFGLTLYAYHAFRIFTPLFLLALFFFDLKALNLKKIALPLLIFLFFILPILTNNQQSLTRFSDVTVFKSLNSAELEQKKMEGSFLLSRIFDNKYLFVSEKLLDNYFSFFSIPVLFGKSRPETSYLNFPYTLLLYPLEIIFWISFVIWAVKKPKAQYKYLAAWFVLAPIPAAIAQDSANANRAITFLPLLPIISGLGLVSLKQFLERFKINIQLTNFLFILVILVNLSAFSYDYLYHLPSQPLEIKRLGYQQVFNEILKREENYQNIIISHVFNEPQIFVAFYQKMDPVTFQQSSQRWLKYEEEGKTYVDQLGSYSLGKYEFRDVAWNDERYKKNVLFASDALNFPGTVSPIFEFKNNKGLVLFKLVEPEANVGKTI